VEQHAVRGNRRGCRWRRRLPRLARRRLGGGDRSARPKRSGCGAGDISWALAVVQAAGLRRSLGSRDRLGSRLAWQPRRAHTGNGRPGRSRPQTSARPAAVAVARSARTRSTRAYGNGRGHPPAAARGHRPASLPTSRPRHLTTLAEGRLRKSR
jgi:hypothetical protein